MAQKYCKTWRVQFTQNLQKLFLKIKKDPTLYYDIQSEDKCENILQVSGYKV